MIAGIILAAGASTRMGSPKALLKIGAKTFLQHIVEELQKANISEIVIVLGANAEKIQQEHLSLREKIIINHNWQQGQLSSLLAGINCIEKKNIDGVIVCPVDHPLISAKLISEMMQTFYSSKKKIIIPVFNKQRGHPVIFAKELFEEIKNAPLEIGARGVLKNFSGEISDVSTKEQGILLNIDTKKKYEEIFLNE